MPSVLGRERVVPLRARLRALASRVRRFPERALHPMRRRKARQLLASAPVPRSILVVCHGNVCRSPYAAMALQRELPEPFRSRIEVRSAGFVGPGRGSPPGAVAVAARLGIDLTPHRSELLTPENTAAADLILVMDVGQQTAVRRRFGKSGRQVLVLGDLDPDAIEKRTIRDPWNQPEDVFESSYLRIDRCVAALVSVLVTRDPFSGGAA